MQQVAVNKQVHKMSPDLKSLQPRIALVGVGGAGANAGTMSVPAYAHRPAAQLSPEQSAWSPFAPRPRADPPLCFAVNNMVDAELEGVDFFVCNTDAQVSNTGVSGWLSAFIRNLGSFLHAPCHCDRRSWPPTANNVCSSATLASEPVPSLR